MGELITQAYAKANERELDVLTELLEAPDTIKLIADTLAKVRKPILLMKQLAHFLSSNKGLKGTAQYADKAVELCREVERHLVVGKARRKGYSYKNGFLVANLADLYPNSTSAVS